MTTPTTSCPFHDPERLFEEFEAVRREAGLPYAETFGARLVTGYDDIVAALHDPTTFSSAPVVPEMPSPWRERFARRVPTRGTLIGVDNPDHDRLRSSINTFFRPRRLARYEPWIREQAHLLVDRFAADGQTDLKTSFALPLPLRVINRVVGLDVERADWVGEALGFFLGPRDIHHPGTPDEKAAKLLDLHDHLLDLMEQRRTNRRDDLISHIWDQRDSGAVEMTDFEMLSMFPGLMLAGHETTSNLICMALVHLLTEPARYEAAQRDDGSRAAALEEMFRFESAITGMKRLVTTDTDLGGVPLSAGEVVSLAYAAGSRDPGRFQSPDRVDLERGWSVPHLGFGQGGARLPGGTPGEAPPARRALCAARAAPRTAPRRPARGAAAHRGLRGTRAGVPAAGVASGAGLPCPRARSGPGAAECNGCGVHRAVAAPSRRGRPRADHRPR